MTEKRKPLPTLDGRAFIERCEQELEAGNAEFIGQNVARLRRFVSMYQERIYQLTLLQYRARVILDRHEPTYEERIGEET